MRLVYLDTSVYAAAWLSESKRLIYIPYHFDELIKEVIGGEYCITVTKLIENEIKNKYPFLLDNLKELTDELADGIRQVEISKEHIRKAKTLCTKYRDLHKADSIHLAVAKQHADIFVTEDVELYEVASNEMETAWIDEL